MQCAMQSVGHVTYTTCKRLSISHLYLGEHLLRQVSSVYVSHATNYVKYYTLHIKYIIDYAHIIDYVYAVCLLSKRVLCLLI